MRYIIHGAGAVGSLVGAMLAEAGFEVILVARPAHTEAINKHGLIVRSRDGDRQVTNIVAVNEPSAITPQDDDVILLTVKTGHTAQSVQDLRETFDESTPIFCLQNGVRNEELAARRFLRVYGAVAGLSATLVKPGVVAQTLDLKVCVGNYPLGCDERAVAVAADLERAGFKVSTHDRIMAVKWSKLLLNVNNATLTIIDSWVQLARVTPRVAHFMADVMDESRHVLDVAGISLEDKNNPYNIAAQIQQLREVREDPEKIRELREQPVDLRTYPSTWVDVKQKRGESEAGYFNGEIVLLGEKHNVPTPLNSTLLQIVEEMSTKRLEPGRYTLDELEAQIAQRRMKFYNSQGDSH